MRLDSTVTEALMHEPSDSSLLSDAVRVTTRLLDRAEALPAAPAIRWRDRRRLAKKRARAIEYSRGLDKKRPLYRDLIAAAEASRAELQEFAARLAPSAQTGVARWRAEVDRYLPLIERIIAQTQRRVFDGEGVPAGEKLVSLFEPHADIILKGGRQVQYGHKLNLTTGKSGLILDIVIEAGNPADRERFLPMLDRHIARTGAPPRQTAADGGYASRANLAAAKDRGIRDVAFHKKVRHRDGRDGQEPLGLPPPAQLPRRHRSGDLLLQTVIWRRPLHLARPGTLQGLHLVCRGGSQPGAARPPQAHLIAQLFVRD